MLAQVFALLAWEVRLEGLGNEEGGGGRGDWEGGIGEGFLEVSEGLEGAGDEEERYGLANIFPCGESGLLKISFSNRLGGGLASMLTLTMQTFTLTTKHLIKM